MSFTHVGREMSKVEETESAGGDSAAERGVRPGEECASREQKWSFLRAVYPVNPGIPHYLDFPQE